jgi:hypothetical protein
MEQLAALLLLLALPLCGTAISDELLLQLLSLLVVDCTLSQFVVATEWWEALYHFVLLALALVLVVVQVRT